MAQSTNGLNCHQVAGLRAAMPQRIERGDSCAHERCGLLGREPVRHQGHRFGGSDHVLCITAVMREAGDATYLTVDEISSPAWWTLAAMTSIPAHAHSLAFLPEGNIRANFV